MKFDHMVGHLIDINRKFFFFKNHANNEAGRVLPDHFLVFKKALYEVKASGLQLSLNIL